MRLTVTPGSATSHCIRIGLIAVATLVLLTLYARTAMSELGDFDAYYAGAMAIRHGDNPYALALAWRDAGFAVNYPGPRPLEERYARYHSTPYVYPPIFAVAFLPFTLLPAEVGRVAWFTLVFGCMLGAAYVLAGLLFASRPHRRLTVALGLALATAVFQPARASLASAQVDCVLLLLVALAFAAYARRQDWRAGGWLAVAVAIKPFLGFLVLFFLWKRAYRAAAAVAILGGALLLGPTVALGTDVLADFATVARYWSGPSFAVSPINQSIYGLMLRLLTPNAYTVPLVVAPWLVDVVRGGLVPAVMVTLATVVGRSRNESPSRLGLELGAMTMAMLLVSPLTQDIYYTFLIVPLTAIVAASVGSWRRDTSARALGLAALGLYGYFTLPLLRSVAMVFYAFYDGPVSGPKVLLTGVHVYGLVAAAVLVFMTIRWCRRRAGSQASADLSATEASTSSALADRLADGQLAAELGTPGPGSGPAQVVRLSAFRRNARG